MPVQTSYGISQAAGTAGQRASMADDNVITRLCGTAAGIGFGLAVSQGAEGLAVLGGAKFLGVTLKDPTLVPRVGVEVDEYQEGDNMAIMTRGECYVSPVEAVAAGNPVTFDATTGRFGDTTGTVIPGAMWKKGAGANGIAILDLNGFLGPMPVVA